MIPHWTTGLTNEGQIQTIIVDALRLCSSNASTCENGEKSAKEVEMLAIRWKVWEYKFGRWRDTLGGHLAIQYEITTDVRKGGE